MLKKVIIERETIMKKYVLGIKPDMKVCKQNLNYWI